MTITNQWVGRTTPNSARMIAKVTGASASLKVSTDSTLTGATTHGPITATAQGIVTLDAIGLAVSTRYYYAIDDGVQGPIGTFLTHPQPGSQASFTIGVSSCSGAFGPIDVVDDGTVLDPLNVSNHPVFDTIRTKALDENWHMFVDLGDLFYYNLGSDHLATETNYRKAYDDVLLQPRAHQLFREVAFAYAWDDHDFGPNNSDGTFTEKTIARQVYRERVPSYEVPAGDAPIYQTWQIGRVLFILSDTRSERSPNATTDGPGKTMLGTAQKNWMRDVLVGADAEFFVWLTPTPWIAPGGSDTWGGFATEANELVDMFTDTGWIDKMCAVTGDTHYLAIDTGTSGVTYGGIPLFVFGSLDSGSSGSSLAWDTGPVSGGKDRYGTIQVIDDGDRLRVIGTGWIGISAWREYTISLGEAPVQPPPPPPSLASPEFLDAVTGSHQMVVSAQVLKEFAEGEEPIGGIEINVIGGDVTFDSSADIRATCTLTTDPQNYDIEDLLTPYGNEVFLQRGVVIGSGRTEMHPLGYYRITEVTQDNAPTGAVRIEGQDRMSGIIEARLTKPRQFKSGTQIRDVFTDLVNEIYPLAQIVFDDATGSETVGRGAIAERDRYDFLRDLVKARGKLMFWDRLGRLRIQDPPDPSAPKWEISYGEKGVLISLGRSRTRGGTYNAVVASGEAGDTDKPIRAIAIDNDPLSPTYWYGRYGKVPRFYVSPFITRKPHADNAARSILAAQLGVANNVKFNVVPNPSLDLGDAVRVTHDPRIGTATHVLDTLTIPLDAENPVSATTRVYSSQNIELS